MSHLRLLGTLALLVLPLVATAQENNQPPEGFESLFNGQDLSGWHAINYHSFKGLNHEKLAEMPAAEREKLLAEQWQEAQKYWTVENGELVNDGRGPYLTTDREFGDIELWIDYKTVAKADSGIYLRGTPQVQIWDYTEEGGKWDRDADKGSGGLFNNSKGAAGQIPLVFADKPFGEWNRFRIVQVGARTSVWLNGQKVVDNAIMENYWDRERPLFATGPIQLQTHGGEIRWRNLFVREIPAAEANEILRGDDAAFQPIFNGKDLSGWAGPVENYQVSDGAIMCLPGKGGTIYTEKEYGDFVARVEFKLPPGGNNGLAIRYPGQGDTAYVGMTELQVLDDTSPHYAQLDPRQYHGSSYGIAAAHRGYLRPVGEWNYQEVTVKGSTIKVELNGTVILDADLSQINEYLGGSPHPGKDRTRGYFGLAGHSSPVQFRNLSMKPLD